MKYNEDDHWLTGELHFPWNYFEIAQETHFW